VAILYSACAVRAVLLAAGCHTALPVGSPALLVGAHLTDQCPTVAAAGDDNTPAASGSSGSVAKASLRLALDGKLI